MDAVHNELLIEEEAEDPGIQEALRLTDLEMDALHLFRDKRSWMDGDLINDLLIFAKISSDLVRALHSLRQLSGQPRGQSFGEG
jgi:hypothetical protein